MATRTKLSTQHKLIVAYLEKGRTLTNKVALTCLGIGSLSSRVSELRRAGFLFEVEDEMDHAGKVFRKYRLKAAPNAKASGV